MTLTKKDKDYMTALVYEATSLLLLPMALVLLILSDEIFSTLLAIALGGAGFWGNRMFTKERKRRE